MDNGTTVVIAEDYWGNARPQGSEIDVGVYESAALLPISLVEFKAEAQSPDAVTLTWITASEINNDYFNVERSNDGEAFNSIGSITSYGSNSQLELRYAFIDENPLNGRAYYRLKQTDFDGAFTYGPIRIIERNNSHESLAYPNPFVDRVTMRYTGEENMQGLRLSDARGNIIHIENFETGSGDWESSWDMCLQEFIICI